jgi:hypothetical protein
MNARINHLAVWVLVIAHQLIGFGWYAIFGNIWLNLHAKTMTDIENPHDIAPYCVAIVAAIVVNYALARLLLCLETGSAVSGLKIGVLCWFAFLFVEYATISMFSAFGTNPWPLILINMGRPLIAFALSGAVLGAWRKAA